MAVACVTAVAHIYTLNEYRCVVSGNGRDTVMLCANTMKKPRPMPETEVQSPLDAARKLAPLIRSYAEEIEATRELPRPLFEALADAGMFHLVLPRTLGCPELDLPTYIQVIEELGKADASTAWRSIRVPSLRLTRPGCRTRSRAPSGSIRRAASSLTPPSRALRRS